MFLQRGVTTVRTSALVTVERRATFYAFFFEYICFCRRHIMLERPLSITNLNDWNVYNSFFNFRGINFV